MSARSAARAAATESPGRAGAPRLSWGTITRLFGYIGRHRSLMVWSLLTMIAAAGIDLVVPEVVKRAVDGPIKQGDSTGLWTAGILLVGVLVIGTLIRGTRTVLSVAAGRRIGMSLRMDVFEQIQRQGLRFFDRNPVGTLSTRVTGDIEAIEQFFTSGVAAFFHDILKLVLILVVLLTVNTTLALHVLTVVPFLALAVWCFTRFSRRAFGRVRAETARTNAFSTEALSGVRVTRLFGREAKARDDFGNHTQSLCGAHLRTVFHFGWFFPTVNILSGISVAAVIWAGAPRIADGTFTYGEFFQFWMLIDLFFQPIRALSDNLNMLLQAAVSSERLFDILDTEPEIDRNPEGLSARDLRGEIEFEDVDFAYVEDQPVLRSLAFKAEAGTTVALVGPTGAGKTSVLNLISRFYDVQGGSVRVDGQPVAAYDARGLRRRVAVVLQDVFLFRGTVLDNIRLFDATITREQVEDAVRAVHADAVIRRLSGGLDAPVEERGANLSAGERQLIAFARALVHDPAILVLDEATSSIDTETEMRIQRALETLRSGRTTIVVAHRLSTIRSADQILVLRRGEVAERGTHDELVAQDGLYRRLYALQAAQEG